MKKIGHASIESYKMLKFNTFSFFTPRKFFPIMLLMLLIFFRLAMCCICYKVYSVCHLFDILHYIFSHFFVFTWKSDIYVTQLLD